MLGRMKEGDEVFAVFDDELWHPASVERVNGMDFPITILVVCWVV